MNTKFLSKTVMCALKAMVFITLGWGVCKCGHADNKAELTINPDFDSATEAAQQLSAIATKTKNQLVSVVSAPTSYHEKWRVSDDAQAFSRVANILNANIAVRDDTVLIYRIVPDWQRQVFDANSVNEFALNVHRLITSMTPIEIGKLVAGERIKTISMSEEQKAYLVAMYVHSLGGVPPAIVAKERARTTALINKPDAVFHLSVTPSLSLYSDTLWLGQTDMTVRDNGLPVLQPGMSAQDNVGSLKWLKLPFLIEPAVSVDNASANLVVKLERESSVWTVNELVAEIKKQTGIILVPDKGVKESRVFISNGMWPIRRLLKSVSIVAGLEVRQIEDLLFWGQSPVHKIVTDLFLSRIQMENFYAELRERLVPFTQTPRFLERIAPFDRAKFIESKVLSLDRLAQNERNLILDMVHNTIPTPAKTQILPLLVVAAGIQSEVGVEIKVKDVPTLFKGMTSHTSLTADTPELPLNQPKTNTWQAYPKTTDLLELYGARVIE